MIYAHFLHVKCLTKTLGSFCWAQRPPDAESVTHHRPWRLQQFLAGNRGLNLDLDLILTLALAISRYDEDHSDLRIRILVADQTWNTRTVTVFRVQS